MFLRRECVEVSNRSLYADIGCGKMQQKCFKGTQPAKSGVITYDKMILIKHYKMHFSILLRVRVHAGSICEECLWL